ncbi:ScbA/BarX family gamma-butyrolactone biosynthesis protein [Streptomyces alkaliphilus]|uniref:ScbA/BarX family gamma-butyrolactone biosynthesis protein n=1 Tax=Streptomyces alkaliphilus TaxID=1472722 RepID=UPI001180C6E5|nr:ScbA/BarX family gamma-butyrolactone biosynthesis protein [Streptomyces alkaliphilus]MQS06050.1 transcriptional regulator [Streptomyces alkaliphilus]
MALPVEQGVPTVVPQEWTHKANAKEVLCDRWWRTGPDSFTVTAPWPEVHGFYLTRHGLYDPLLLDETIRQALPVISHAAYDVPLGHQLIWHDFHWALCPDALAIGETPVGIELRITCSHVTYRGARAAGVSLRVEALHDGVSLGSARTRYGIQSRAVYERLRGRCTDVAAANARALPLPSPAPAVPAGRENFDDVVLCCADSANRWQLRVDTAHPVLFNHPVDHAPDMLLLEAARQAAHTPAHPRPVVVAAMDMVFTRDAELDAPCCLKAETLPDDLVGRARVRVVGHQIGDDVFTSVLTLATVG